MAAIAGRSRRSAPVAIFLSQHIMPAAGDVALRFRAKLFGRPVDEAIVKRGEEALPAPLAILEDHLTHNKWMMGAESMR